MSRGPFRVEIHIDAWLCATPFRLELMEHCHSAHSTTEISIGSTLGFAQMDAFERTGTHVRTLGRTWVHLRAFARTCAHLLKYTFVASSN